MSALPSGHRPSVDDDLPCSVALGAACAAFVAVPTLGPLLGGGEQSERYDTVITPPDWAFTIWAPIFATCAASTVEQCRRSGRRTPAGLRTAWPLATAYAVNALWSVAAQTRFGLTPYLLPVAAGAAAVAHARLQDGPPGEGRATELSTGLLLGWTALASSVNVAAVARPGTRVATAGLAVTSTALAGAVARSRRGAVPLAASAGWGLLATALSPGRPRAVRLTAAAGATGLAVSAARRPRMSVRGDRMAT